MKGVFTALAVRLRAVEVAAGVEAAAYDLQKDLSQWSPWSDE